MTNTVNSVLSRSCTSNYSMGLIVSHLVKQTHVNLDTNFKTCDVKFVSILEEIIELLIFYTNFHWNWFEVPETYWLDSFTVFPCFEVSEIIWILSINAKLCISKDLKTFEGFVYMVYCFELPSNGLFILQPVNYWNNGRTCNNLLKSPLTY